LATGSSWICSGTILVEESVFVTSTSETWPITLTVSATCATFIVTPIRAVWPTRRVTPFCSTVAKPANSTFTS
jgi:hypothetical protein